MRRDSLLEKIFARCILNWSNGCLEWTGPTSGDSGRGHSYPRMTVDGQTCAVHRVVATHYYGYLPSRRQVDHTCKNRSCVAPWHLEPVTHRENQRRRVGRRPWPKLRLVA